ncbi:MAG: type IV pilus assembly protein PilM [Actinomycetota bacterium]
MLSTSKEKSVVGLDIEAGSVAAAEVGSNGTAAVAQTAIAPLDPGVFKEGEVVDADALAEALRSLFATHKLSKTVRVGVANQRVSVRTLRLPLIENPEELDTAIRFQAQEHLPMPDDQAVIDHQVAARHTNDDGTRSMDVVAVAARRDMLSTLLSAVRGAGLRPIGIDLSAFAMIRALAREAADPAAAATEPDPNAAPTDGEYMPTALYCNLGDVTNLAVARGSTCLFTRISPFGVEVIAQRLAERRTLALDHARQWLAHVGLERPTFDVEGDAEIVAATREVLEEGASKLADELRLSLEFYGAQEGAPAVERIVVAGPGTTIPGLIDRLQSQLGQTFSTARPSALAQLGDEAAARLTVSYGLALEE